METCTYISGPPCAGKSTVARQLLESIQGLTHLPGDPYWVRHSDLDFGDRAAAVEQCLLAALRDSGAGDILCEWVPCRGPFVAQLHHQCASAGGRFYHVILTAPLPVLKRRKLARDGNDDLGPAVGADPEPQRAYPCQVFDTTLEGATDIAGKVGRQILANRAR